MVWPLPPLSGAALVPRGRRGQSDEPAVSALPQDRAGVARDVLDAGPFAAQRAEETAHRIGVFWAAARSLPRFPLPTAGWPAGSSIAFTLALVACHRDQLVGGQSLRHWAHEARQYSIMPWWNSRGDERRHEAFRRLVEIGEPAVPTLLELLHQGIPMSGDALNALCQLGPRASSGVPALIRILGETDGDLDADREVRHRAESTLAALRPRQ